MPVVGARLRERRLGRHAEQTPETHQDEAQVQRTRHQGDAMKAAFPTSHDDRRIHAVPGLEQEHHHEGGGHALSDEAARRFAPAIARGWMRPPLAHDRLQALPGKRFRYEIRRPCRAGTVAIEFCGQELIERLVALIPAPRATLVRCHGTLGPNARLRASIVPRAAETPLTGAGGRACGGVGKAPGPDRSGKASSWAELMRRACSALSRGGLEAARCRAGRWRQS
jgi:hypothetical protein